MLEKKERLKPTWKFKNELCGTQTMAWETLKETTPLGFYKSKKYIYFVKK